MCERVRLMFVRLLSAASWLTLGSWVQQSGRHSVQRPSLFLHAVVLSSFLILPSSFLLAAGFVHETDQEFTASADFNGDGHLDLLILDKQSGTYRTGYGAGTGAYTFAESRPTGAANITGVAVGKLSGLTNDAFAVTSADQNRVQVLRPSTSGFTEPMSVPQGGLGPTLLAALNLPLGPAPTAEDDLAVLASRDLADGVQIRQIRSNAGAWSLLRTDNAPDAPCLHGNPILPGVGAPRLFAFMRDDGFSNDSFHAWLLDGAAGSQQLVTLDASNNANFICEIFEGTDADVMFWTPWDHRIRVRRIQPVGPGWDFVSDGTFNMPIGSLAQVVPVQTPTGMKVLMRNTFGSLAIRGYTLAGGFGPAENLAPAAGGAVLNGIIPTGPGSFQLLYASDFNGFSDRVISYSHNGTSWVQGATTLMTPRRPSAQFANVLLLGAPLFRTETTELLYSFQAPDWTTGVALGPPVNASAGRFADSTTGIGTPSAQVLGTGVVAAGSAVNQLHNQFSLFSFQGSLGAVIDAVQISPTAGAYEVAQQITFSGLNGGTSVYFRLDATSAFQVWNAANPPWITRASTVEYYSQNAAGAGAVQRASYTFTLTPALQDADGDGVPDFVEIAHGMDPAGGEDADGDGFTDLDELAAGTNPNDALSIPATQANSLDTLLVDARAQIRDVTSGVVIGIAAAGTEITLSDPFGNELGSGTIGSGGASPGFGRITARSVDPRKSYIVCSTNTHFSTAPAGTNEPRGRQLIALVPALEPEVWSWATPNGAIGTTTPWSWGGTNWQEGSMNWSPGFASPEGYDGGWSQRQLDTYWDAFPTGPYSAAGWVTELQAAANRGARPYAEVTLSPSTSLVALIVSKIVGDFILERAPDAEIEGPAMFFDEADALFGFLDLRHRSETTPTASIARVIAVLKHVDDRLGNAGDPGAQALRKLARDVYAQHNALAANALDTLPFPLDALTEFVKTGIFPAAYLPGTALTLAERNAATAKLSSLCSTAPERTSITQTFFTRYNAPTPGLSLLEDESFSSYLMLDESIRPLSLPDTSEAPYGTPIQITAYDDLPTIAGYAALEVTSLSLLSLPMIVGDDTDRDLMADNWELRFFGTLDHDETFNSDGSLYSIAQEYVDGTSPLRSSSSPVLGPVRLALRNFRIASLGGGSFRLSADWPESYAGVIDVMVEGTPDLREWFLPNPAEYLGGGEFAQTVSGFGPRFFFRAFPAMKR